MIFLDTSIPLEAMMPASKHFNECREIMGVIESGRELAITSPLTFAELHHILSKREGEGTETVKQKLTALLNCVGLQVVDLDASLMNQIVNFAAKYGIDFTDATNVLLMQKYEITAIYSLDAHYDMFKEIKRFSILAGR